MGAVEAAKWDLRYVDGRKVKGNPEGRRAFHVAYLMSMYRRDKEAFAELVSMVKEAIDRVNHGESSQDVLFGGKTAEEFREEAREYAERQDKEAA